MKCLVISTNNIFEIIIDSFHILNYGDEINLEFELFNNLNRNKKYLNKLENDVFQNSDLIFVEIDNIIPSVLFEIGIARAIGKTIVFITKDIYLKALPMSFKYNITISYFNSKDLSVQIGEFLTEFLENPKRFISNPLIELQTNNKISIDLEKLDSQNFENLCFELLTNLGYKQLEWKIKDEFLDAVTTLKKQDPDGYEYDEFWLISFGNRFFKSEMFEIFKFEPDYFVERIYRSLDSEMINNNKLQKSNTPFTLLFIFRGIENNSKSLMKELSNREFRLNRRGNLLTFRIRWWDDQTISSLLKSNNYLAQKYFSSDALVRSNIRLSYEELYRDNLKKNDELQKTNNALILERSKIESLERDAAWKLLSFTAAHRLGNPMDAIDTEISNLKEAKNSGNYEIINEIIDTIDAPVERAKSIIAEFRNLSIAQEIKPQVIDFEKLFSLLKYSAKQAIDKGITVDFFLDEIPDISIDIQKVSECFDEIIRNSIRFMHSENKLITISTSNAGKIELPDKIDKSKKYIKITFKDNGCGVSGDRKKEIFKPFETSYIHGTGLGLAFCETIIECHGGKIREIGNLNECAIFEIFLPIFTKELTK